MLLVLICIPFWICYIISTRCQCEYWLDDDFIDRNEIKITRKTPKKTKHRIKVWSYHIIKRVIQLLWCLNRFNLVTKIILLNWMVYASRKNINVHIKRLFGHVSIYCKQFWHQYYHHSSRCMYIIPPTSSRNEFNFLPFIPLPKKNIETGIACSSRQVSKRASEWVRLWLKSQCRFSMETGDTDALLIQFSKIVFSLETRKTTRNIDADADKFAI